MESRTIHPDFLAAQKLAYEPLFLKQENLIFEKESQEYAACSFQMNNKIIKFRVAKTTPLKIGKFVTAWKRIGDGPIMPYDMSDSFDFLVISVRNRDSFGQFVFPKEILWHKGFVSKEGKGGKRAMRVYPPWDRVDSALAKKTQSWQLLYYVGIEPIIDRSKIIKLFYNA